MDIRILCPSCKTSYAIDDALCGKRIICRNCKQQIMIPNRNPTPPPEATGGERRVAPAPRSRPEPAKPVARVRPRDDEANADEAVPQPRARKAKKPAGRSSAALVWGGVAGLVVVAGVVALLVSGGWGWGPSTNDDQPQQVAQNPGPEPPNFPEVVPEAPEPTTDAPKDAPPQQEQAGPGDAPTGQPPPAPLSGQQQEAAPVVPPPAPQQMAEVSKRGKASTALLELRGRPGHATAFCVHPSGLFLTNEHAVRLAGPDGTVTLVTDPALKTQQVFQAKVIRVNKETDLALLRIEGRGTFPALPLGSLDQLAELTEVVAVGFPFGKSLALEKGAYPAVSVNSGRVTSLRSKGGELHRIQLDVALNPGNSGGPVLDAKGEVVGVVVSGVVGAQVNFAIPVSHAKRFLATPDFQFTPPAVDYARRYKPVVFQVKVATLLPSDRKLELELILKADAGGERKFPLKGTGDVYQVTAPALVAPAGAASLPLEVIYDGGSVRGVVTDRAFQIGERKLRLSEIRELQTKPNARAILHSEEAVAGALAGLDAVPVRLGGETFTVNIARAVRVRLERPAEPDQVSCTVVARGGGREVGRVTHTLRLRSVPAAAADVAAAPQKPVPITGAPLKGEKVEVSLPNVVGEVCVGRGGRLLILHMPAQRNLAVFDVNVGKIVKYIPVAEDNIKFAAGMDKLFVANPTANVLQRFNLDTFAKELTVPLPVEAQFNFVAMGSASRGPLLLCVGTDIVFLDPLTMKELNYECLGQRGEKRQRLALGGHPPELRVSANGQVFAAWRPNQSPTGISIYRIEGQSVKGVYEHTTAGELLPSPDGRIVFAQGQLYTPLAKPIGKGAPRNERPLYVPAAHGSYYLSLTYRDRWVAAGVHLPGQDRALLSLPKMEALDGMVDWVSGRHEPFERHVHFIPDAKLLVIMPAAKNKLLLYRLDIDEALDKSGIDYLIVTSPPPAEFIPGETLNYRIGVKSKRGGVKIRVDSGPDGMSVSPERVLTWRVPVGITDTEVNVILTISDATGQEIFQTFKLTKGKRPPKE